MDAHITRGTKKSQNMALQKAKYVNVTFVLR